MAIKFSSSSCHAIKNFFILLIALTTMQMKKPRRAKLLKFGLNEPHY